MRYTVIAVILALLTATFACAEEEPVPSILSIIPGQAAPGGTVVVSGSGFTDDTVIYLGIEEIPRKSATSRQISFEIPQIPSGNYALYLRQKDGTASKTYSFAVVPLKPLVTAIHPDSISFCAAGSSRQITVKGRNFAEGAKVVFDGATINSSRTSTEEMSFTAPTVPGGLHQVQVRNQEEAVSSAVAFMVTNRPEITSVNQGNDYVNYYELNIDGINFQQGSALIVDGRKIQSGQSGDRDRLIFNSCSRLTYLRYPYDPSMKSFHMIIINPNGEESSHFTVSAP